MTTTITILTLITFLAEFIFTDSNNSWTLYADTFDSRFFVLFFEICSQVIFSATAIRRRKTDNGSSERLLAAARDYSGLICNCSPKGSFEEVDDEEDDGSNCK